MVNLGCSILLHLFSISRGHLLRRMKGLMGFRFEFLSKDRIHGIVLIKGS